MEQKKETKEFVVRLLITFGVTWMCLQVLHPYTVRELSMYPTLNDGDRIVVSGLDRKPDRGEIVIFKDEKIHLIKRVAGVPGDTVETKNGKVYINGKEVADSREEQNFTLKEDEYYMLGDNLPVSRDSRMIGPVKQKALRGVLLLRFFPRFEVW